VPPDGWHGAESGMSFAAGQQWRYRAPAEIAGSRLVIGALVEFESGRCIACCAVTGALGTAQGGASALVTVPFIPMTLEALAHTVTDLDGTAEVPSGFVEALDAWRADPRGASCFTVPFEGSLERMIARQMAAIVAAGKATGEI
jgi:hypothetical protein